MFYHSAFGLSKGEIAGICFCLRMLSPQELGRVIVFSKDREMNARTQSSSKIRIFFGGLVVLGPGDVG